MPPPWDPQRGGAKGSKPGPTCAKIPLGSRLARDKPENIEIFKNPCFLQRNVPPRAPKGGAKRSKPAPTCAKILLGSRLDRVKPKDIEIFKNPRFLRRKCPPPWAPNLTQMKRKAAIGCIFVVCLSACFGCLRWPLRPTIRIFTGPGRDKVGLL